MKRIFNSSLKRVIGALAIAFVITFSIHSLRTIGASAPDFPCGQGKNSAQTSVEVPSGTSGYALGRILQESGVIASSESYFREAVGNSASARVAPGSHRVQLRICAREALEQMLDADRISNLITVIEGAWVTEVSQSMKRAGFDPRDVDRAFATVKPLEGYKSLEGLIAPALYSFDRSTSAIDAIEAMMKKSKSNLDKSGVSSGSGRFQPHELLTIASIIQAEGDSIDYAKVSRVIRNRLEINMPLQMDSTVHYVKKVRGSIFLSTQSTLLSSPFNTYRRYGLPPGPIGTPGLAAMKAAVNPASGDWIYFITVKPGDTRFTPSDKEFLTWKSEYRKNLANGLFAEREKVK